MSNDISLPEAKLEHALDEYYNFLHNIVKNSSGAVGPGQRLVTMNTITPYSIVKGKPLYNMFVLRAYADLVVRRTSAIEGGSPKAPPGDIIENANSGDSWTSEYYRFAYPNLIVEMRKYIKDPAVLAELNAKRATYNGAYEAYINELDRLELAWGEYVKNTGLSEAADPEIYFRAKNAWWRKRQNKLQQLYNVQFEMLIEISDLEVAHLDARGLLLKDLKDNLSSWNQVKLPVRPELENDTSSDPTKSPVDYDQRPAVQPIGTQVFNDLLDQANDGTELQQLQRGYEIKRVKTTTYSHDTDWNASGSASKFFFLKANLSVSEKTHFEQQIKQVGLIQVGFRAIQDVVIIRGKWYSGSFLKSAEFQKWLDAQPEFREKLRQIITSVIVARGLTVKLSFGTDIHQASWRDLKIKASGGLSIAGWNFGMNGQYSSRTEWDMKDITNNSVTFADGANVCRVLGLKVEDVIGASPKAAVTSEFMVDSPISPALLAEYASGVISYGEFIDKVHQR